jgi:hydroxylamine dehydrogenase
MTSKHVLLGVAAAASSLLLAYGDSPLTGPRDAPVSEHRSAPHPVGQAIGLAELSSQSRECIDCHRKESPGLYQQWGSSKHYRGNVGCYECHVADSDDPDAFRHYDTTIAVIVSPKDCARCHSKEVEQFLGSRHAKAGHILGSLDNVLAEVVEGNRGLVTPGFPEGNSAAAVSGCWQCHGSEIKVLPGGKLDPATWPNTGIGRINPDGTEGSCAACHSRHSFSAAQARHPDTCGKCHLGPDHPQKEIYEESKHGIAFFANQDKMNMDSPKWIVGEDYFAAPTCATCHMSATRNQPVTHDVGMRISWNNRPVISVRPEISDAKMGLPGKDVPWQLRRHNMKDVCSACHNQVWVDNFYVQYDGLVELYNEKFAKPGLALYTAAKPLLRPIKFANKLDFIWFELWHHEGRRARHGASMMGPDYTHWHGTYDLAKHFYAKYIPELEHLIEKGKASSEATKVAAAKHLEDVLGQVLRSPNHRWFLGEMDPEEAARRAEAAKEFKERYGK